MKSKEEFKKRFVSGEFDKLLKDVCSPEDVVKIASDLGYKITVKDILSEDLSDDMLSAVAGGKRDTYNYYTISNSGNNNGSEQTAIIGDDNKQMKV